MVYVYELRVGERVIDVGMSNNLERRLHEHTNKRPNKQSCGKYYGRTDITIHQVSEWPTRKLAFKEEGILKESYGFEHTESNFGKHVHYSARTLTMEIARELRSKYVFKKNTCKMLAKEYNTTYKVVYDIIKHRTYIDV